MSKLNKKKLERKLKKYIKEDKLENAVKTANKLSECILMNLNMFYLKLVVLNL